MSAVGAKMKLKLLALSVLGFISTSSYALQCTNAYGSTQNLNFNVSKLMNSSDNQVGKLVIADTISNGQQIKAICPREPSGLSYRNYMLANPSKHYVVETIQEGIQLLYFNEYINGGFQILSQGGVNGPAMVTPPVGNVAYKDTAVASGQWFVVMDHQITLYIRIKKPFVGTVSMPTSTLINVYIRTSAADGNGTPVYNISFSGYIEAPQSCEVNAKQIVKIDFGNVSANAFKGLRPGEKPSSVQPITRQVAVQCTNVNAQALLTLSLEANDVTGDIIKSSNPDVGFKLSDTKGKVLTPNNINSNIPFKMLQNPIYIPIDAWPVSLTGKPPTQLGPFTSTGVLRVDYQ